VLELYAGKLARTVLRGLGRGYPPSIFFRPLDGEGKIKRALALSVQGQPGVSDPGKGAGSILADPK